MVVFAIIIMFIVLTAIYIAKLLLHGACETTWLHKTKYSKSFIELLALINFKQLETQCTMTRPASVLWLHDRCAKIDHDISSALE